MTIGTIVLEDERADPIWRSTLKLDKNLGMLLLAIWLIVTGLASLGVSFSGIGTITGLLALASGILLLMRR
jgi:hypothetical protein